jgi:micrococcal nuclease
VTRFPKRLVGLALLAAAWSGTASCGGAPPATETVGSARPPDTGTYLVTKVTDGDTFHVVFGGQDDRVRLIGIDTPEVPWYGGQEDCFGVKAGEYAKGRLGGQRVRLVFDVDQRDRYGRLLAYVYLGDEFFNLTLVEQGYARVDTVPPNVRFATEFAQAQAKTEAAGLGLWSACPAG